MAPPKFEFSQIIFWGSRYHGDKSACFILMFNIRRSFTLTIKLLCSLLFLCPYSLLPKYFYSQTIWCSNYFLNTLIPKLFWPKLFWKSKDRWPEFFIFGSSTMVTYFKTLESQTFSYHISTLTTLVSVSWLFRVL